MEKMKILHIATNYSLNKLYNHLLHSLEKQGINQYVYIPIKDKKYMNSNILKNENIEFYYSPILNKQDRYLYKHKIKKQRNDIITCDSFKIQQIGLVHAHTWYSDGGTAYLLKKRYGIPYIISIRNTDVNLFYKYYIHYRNFGLEILKNADKIIFISESYKSKVIQMLDGKYDIENKSLVIPNGIHNDWFDIHRKTNGVKEIENFKMLFIGKLNKSKNLENVIRACEMLKFNYTLNVVGDGKLFPRLKKLAESKNVNIKFHGYISSNEEIKEIMKDSDLFILASHFETFGISYIEALSQGLPIIYTKGEGVDNMFESTSKVGEKVNSRSITDISKKIELVRDNYDEYVNQGIKEINNFSWDKISEIYGKLYLEINNEIY